MKIQFLLVPFLWSTTLFAEDITTLSGKKYIGVTIKRIEADGLTIIHDVGVTKVPFIDLSEELRKKFGYDPMKAEAAIKQREIDAAAAQVQAAETQKAEAAKSKKATADSLVPGSSPRIALVTAEAVKQYWLSRIVEPRSLDVDFRKRRDANLKLRNAITGSKYDEVAQDEANRLNIDILLKSGRAEEARILQQARKEYAERVDLAQQRKEQQQQFDQLHMDMQLQQSELQSIRSQMDSLQRQNDGFIR